MKKALVILTTLIPLATAAEQLNLDMDCDGKIDIVRLENSKDKAKISVTIAKDVSVHELEFGLGSPGLQSSLCGSEASISKEPLSELNSEEIGVLPGYKASEQCHGIKVSGGDCDSMHVYWNHDKQTIYWWRL
jgi:hypothetical protein